MIKQTLFFLFTFLMVLLCDCSSSKHATIKKQILGVWGRKGETVNDFRIYKDSIYSIYEEKFQKYVLTKEDTLVIFSDGIPKGYKVIMNGPDTLITISKDSTKSCFIRAK